MVVFCDSNCELWYTKLKELNLKLIKMPYTLDEDEKAYDCGEKTDFKDFYKKMQGGKLPTTSALNPTDYINYFEPYFKKNEDILYIAFSSKLSATFDYMNRAVEELSKSYPSVKFKYFDTKSISMGAGLQVYLAAKYAKEGHTIDEVIEYLKNITNKIATLFMVDNLFHLKRGGRLSFAEAVFGSLLHIKPVLKINEEGKVTIFSKKSGTKVAHNFMFNEVVTNYSPIDNCPIVLLHTGEEESVKFLEEKLKSAFPDIEIWKQPIGPTIGSHVGPGAVGIVFPSKKR